MVYLLNNNYNFFGAKFFGQKNPLVLHLVTCFSSSTRNKICDTIKSPCFLSSFKLILQLLEELESYLLFGIKDRAIASIHVKFNHEDVC
jgi:hypothetical protein